MKKFEQLQSENPTKERKMSIFNNLNKVEVFNSFLNDRLKTSKRFGVEGCDTLISGLSTQLLICRRTGVGGCLSQVRVHWFRYGTQRKISCPRKCIPKTLAEDICRVPVTSR